MSLSWFTRLFSFKREGDAAEEEEEEVNNGPKLEVVAEADDLDDEIGSEDVVEKGDSMDETLEGGEEIIGENEMIHNIPDDAGTRDNVPNQSMGSEPVKKSAYVKDEEDSQNDEDKDIKPDVLYKCPFCFLVYAEGDGLAEHLPEHREEIYLRDSSSSDSLTEPKKENMMMPTTTDRLTPCAILLTRCDSMTSSTIPSGDVEEVKPEVVKEEVTSKSKKMPKSLSRIFTPSGMNVASMSNSELTTLTRRRTTASRSTQSCTICSRTFFLRSNLQQHMLTHGNPNGRRFNCSFCPKSFTNAQSLNRHIQTHPPPLARCWVALTRCDQAIRDSESSSEKKPRQGQFGSSQKPVKYEVVASGSGSEKYKRFRCTFCPKSFSYRVNLQSHSYTHTKEKKFKCPLCPKSFSQPGNVNLHIRTHTLEKPYQCGTCSRTFSQLSHLQHHIPTHDQDKQHKCTICHKGFAQIFNLKSHMFTHGGPRPYQCPTCPKAFIQRANLNIHIRSHTGERPFQCRKCPKAYASSTILKIHSRRHASDLKYQCPRCRMCYATRAGLNRHIEGPTDKPTI